MPLANRYLFCYFTDCVSVPPTCLSVPSELRRRTSGRSVQQDEAEVYRQTSVKRPSPAWAPKVNGVHGILYYLLLSLASCFLSFSSPSFPYLNKQPSTAPS